MTAERQNHNRSDAGLQQLVQDLKVAARMADLEEMPADVAIKLYIEAVKLKFVSGDRKLEIASLALKLQESVDGDEGDDTSGTGGSLQTGEE